MSVPEVVAVVILACVAVGAIPVWVSAVFAALVLHFNRP